LPVAGNLLNALFDYKEKIGNVASENLGGVASDSSDWQFSSQILSHPNEIR
jgi:hypothetical protein